jgi:hypothetical protein
MLFGQKYPKNAPKSVKTMGYFAKNDPKYMFFAQAKIIKNNLNNRPKAKSTKSMGYSP